MIYCKIADELVIDRAVFDGPLPEDWPDKKSWIATEEAQIGWSYDGFTFKAPEPPPIAPSPIATLTARQLRIALVTSGIALDQVEDAIAEIADLQARAVAQIEWEYASQFERDHPLIAQVANAMGLEETEIDEMWSIAKNL